MCHDDFEGAPQVVAAPIGGPMLETIIVILVILWLLGYFAFPAVGGGLIHILLVIAIIVILIRVIQGRRPI
jgi:hypothetical protein